MRNDELKYRSGLAKALSLTVWPLEGFIREAFSEDVGVGGSGPKKMVSTLCLKIFFRPFSII